MALFLRCGLVLLWLCAAVPISEAQDASSNTVARLLQGPAAPPEPEALGRAAALLAELRVQALSEVARVDLDEAGRTIERARALLRTDGHAVEARRQIELAWVQVALAGRRIAHAQMAAARRGLEAEVVKLERRLREVERSSAETGNAAVRGPCP